jgi:hypothetical protein
MAIEDLREIGNVLYERRADGMLYPVRRVRPDTEARGVPPQDPSLLNVGGIGERLAFLNQTFNPVEGIGGAMRAGERLFSQDADYLQRIEALGSMMSGVAGIAAPIAAARAIGVPAASAMMEGLLGGSPTTQAAGDMARRFGMDESGALPGAGRGQDLPTPRNEAEAMARDILQLRAEGRADEVTEQMMAAADDQYMYFNTPLPMDTASRMARAEAMGARPEYHGTTSGSEMRYPRTDYSSGTRKGIGFVTSSDPYVSSSYADPSYGSVFPMMNRVPSGGFPTIDAGGEIWSQIPGDAMVSYAGREVPVSSYASGPADMGGVFDTNQVSRGAAIEGDPGVQFNNILDRSIHAPRPKTDDGMEIMREFQRRSSEPSTVTMRQDTRGMRSRFARFDPAFANLRNLSAGVGGAAVLTALGDDAEAGTPEMQIIGLVNQAGIAGAAEALGVSRRDIEEAMSIALPPSQWDQLVVGPQ